MDRPFIEKEVKDVVFSSNASKAPGPDGFSFFFYQSCWDIVKGDIMIIIRAFYHNKLDISKLNLASIYLIPKKKRC
jgi:hypothetical protein